ncbi:cupin domain-containing protein [Candidatus Aerophobetes bacterium]|nr:cupin domain-containing protein [Candidatus Aerophobetes bacterium]
MERKKYVFKVEEIEPIPLTEKGYTGFLLSDNVLLSFIEQPPGAEFPLHKHEEEQIMIILEGSEEHIVDGQRIHMEKGDVCIHPPNVEHGGYTATGFKGIDIFVPPRRNYIELIKKYKEKKESKNTE